MKQPNPREVVYSYIDNSIHLIMTLQLLVKILFLALSIYVTSNDLSFLAVIESLKENVIGILSVFAAPSFTFLLKKLIRKNIQTSWKKKSSRYNVSGEWDVKGHILKKVRLQVVPIIDDKDSIKYEADSNSKKTVIGCIRTGIVEFHQDAFNLSREYKFIKVNNDDELPKLRTLTAEHFNEDTIYYAYKLDQPNDLHTDYLRTYDLGVGEITVDKVDKSGTPCKMTGYWMDSIPKEIARKNNNQQTYTILIGLTEYEKKSKNMKIF